MKELYGEVDVNTQEWSDGLASIKIREFAISENASINKWVIFDGPVDALWIENMNTVLDDNMTLCLSNGERIWLKPEMSMIFECEELSQASPATVSRCGMVYSAATCGWQLIVWSWLDGLDKEYYPEKVTGVLWDLFLTYVEDGIIDKMNLTPLVEAIPTQLNNWITSVCRLIEAVIGPHSDFLETHSNDPIDIYKRSLNRVFIFCIAFGMGGSLDSHSYDRFESIVLGDFPQSDQP